MKKAFKVVLILLAVALAITLLFWFLSWFLIIVHSSGVFNFLSPKEIATYDSPDGKYTLVFEQLGDPEWPFGPTDIRFTLKNSNGKRIERVSTKVGNDGAPAMEYNIQSITWKETEVVIAVEGNEMEDQVIIIKYK